MNDEFITTAGTLKKIGYSLILLLIIIIIVDYTAEKVSWIIVNYVTKILEANT